MSRIARIVLVGLLAGLEGCNAPSSAPSAEPSVVADAAIPHGSEVKWKNDGGET